MKPVGPKNISGKDNCYKSIDCNYAVNIYLFKAAIETLEKGVKYAQS